MNEEQLELIGLTADSPQGGTLVAERDPSQSAVLVLPKKSVEEREALCALTMEEISEYGNLKLAFKKVKANDGAPGIDRKTIGEVEANLEEILNQLQQQLKQGEYKPGDIRRAWIPKSGGGEKRAWHSQCGGQDRTAGDASKDAAAIRARVSCQQSWIPSWEKLSHGDCRG